MNPRKTLGILTATALGVALVQVARAAGQEPDQEAPPTLRGVLVEDGRFTSFLELMQAAGLARLLDGGEAWTVFAPTDDAWERLGEGVHARLSEEAHRGELIQLASHHVVEGRRTLEELGKIARFPSLHGTNLALRMLGDGTYAIDSARMLQVDLRAANGVVHVLDAPLIPPGLSLVNPRSLYGDGKHEYGIDPVHSTVLFRVMHMEIGACWGWFREFEGRLEVDASDPRSASLAMTVQVASIDTGNASRDATLCSKTFFDAPQYPSMQFESRSVEELEGGGLRLRGDLTWRAITKSVDCVVRKLGEGTFGPDEYRVGYEGELTILRSEFGVTFGIPDVAGDEVRILIALEAARRLDRDGGR